MALEYAFADAWGREGLPRREKSLLIIGALIALRQSSELKNHVKIGASNGLSVKDFESIVVQLAPYVGFPCIATATTAVIEALRAAGRLLANGKLEHSYPHSWRSKSPLAESSSCCWRELSTRA